MDARGGIVRSVEIHGGDRLPRTCLNDPRGRDAVFAGCDARSEELSVVNPLKRQATLQRARKGASRMGFDALARTTLLRALQMRYGHSARRASRTRASASETRLTSFIETGSGYNAPLSMPSPREIP